MKYFDPNDCCNFLNKTNIALISINDCKKLAELERPFADRYYDFVNRSPEEREDNVVNGKFGEFYAQTWLANSGYRIIRGVAISEKIDPTKNPDDGNDFIISLNGSNQGIQIKFCERYFNISEHQEYTINKCFNRGIKVLVCHRYLCPPRCKYYSYKLRYLTKDIFNNNLLDSKQDGGYKYICPDKIPKFVGQF